MASLTRLAKSLTAVPQLSRQILRLSSPLAATPFPTIVCKPSLVQARWHHAMDSAADSQTAKVQRPAPDFKGTAVVNGQFKEVSLSDFKGKYLVLFFYPLDFTFVCPTEVIAFNDRADEFRSLNAELVAVSVDSHFSHLAWVNTPRNKGGLGVETKIPILSDLKKSIAASYGVLAQSSDIALRGLYIIDTKGIVRQITINDLPVGRSVDETLRLIKAFQFVDEHGEVCPANWQPKSKTIDPKRASEFFSSTYKS